MLLLIALITYYTLVRGLIGASEEFGGAKSYGALTERALGARARGALHAAVFVTCWVIEIVFLVVLADLLVGDPPESATAECQGLLAELAALARLPAPPCSRPLALGALCALLLLPLGALRR